jgi:hypothetical protein
MGTEPIAAAIGEVINLASTIPAYLYAVPLGAAGLTVGAGIFLILAALHQLWTAYDKGDKNDGFAALSNLMAAVASVLAGTYSLGGEEVRPLVVGLVSAICWAGGELIASYWNDSWMIKLAGLLKGLGATSAALFGFGIWHPTLRAYTPRIVAGLTGVATAGTLVAGGRHLYDVPSISERLSALLDTLRSRLQERGASVPLLGSSGDPFDDLEAGTYGSMGTTTGRSGDRK